MSHLSSIQPEPWSSEDNQAYWEAGKRQCRFWFGKAYHDPEIQSDIQDLVQEAIIALFIALKKGTVPEKNNMSYFHGILRHLFLNQKGRKWEKLQENAGFATEESWQEAASALTALSYYEQKARQMSWAFSEMMAKGQNECVDLLRQSYETEMRDEDLAHRWGLTKDYIRVKRSRCLATFRQILNHLIGQNG